MNVLITGGAGFIGSNLTHSFIRDGGEVTVLDDLYNGTLQKIQKTIKKIKFVEGSVTNAGVVEKAVSGCEVVFHEAALISVPDSFKNPEKFREVNVQGTRNVLEACRKHDVEKVVLASSAAIYGDEPSIPKTEESPVLPQSPYAESKLQNEKDAKRYFEEYGLETVCLRYFNVYGPGQDPKSPYSGVISKFAECALENREPVIFGDGKQTRDFVFVRDVVNANILAMEKKGIGGEVFNVATGKETSLLELWGHLKEISGASAEPVFREKRDGDIYRSVAGIEKAGKVLGYEPQYSIRKGLDKTMEWVKNDR